MNKPKWYKYSKSDKPVIIRCTQQVGHSAKRNTLVLVEDVASACAVSEVYDSMALLGTNFFASYLPFVKLYEKIYVCLDKDATDKAIDMAMMLNNFVPTKLVPLEKDLKHFAPMQMRAFFDGLKV